MLSIAVIGAGRIGQIHARNIAAHGHARLAGVTDLDTAAAGRLAASCGAAVLSLDDAFRADAVLIGSPTPTHADYIERAAAAGKAIFCEKPIDLSAERVRACLAAVKRAGVPLMVGFNRRFDPHFASLKARLDAGEIGAVELLTIISRDPAPPPPSLCRDSGGLFRDMMIHDLDMARFLLGEEPVEVYRGGFVPGRSRHRRRRATWTPQSWCCVPPAAACARSPTRGARPTVTTSGSRCMARVACCELAT